VLPEVLLELLQEPLVGKEELLEELQVAEVLLVTLLELRLGLLVSCDNYSSLSQ
jgi:hypothetical protein